MGGVTGVWLVVASVEKHHPGVGIGTVRTDGSEAERALAGLGEILLPGDLLPDREWADMAAIYDADEFAGALKPYLLARLVGDGGTALYLSPSYRSVSSSNTGREGGQLFRPRYTGHTG